MRVVEITKDFDRGIKFKAGKRYVMAEDTESQLRSVSGSSMGLSLPLDNFYRPYKGEDLTGKKLMTWRTGGIGDLFMLQPALRYIKEKYPTCYIRVATGCKEPLMNSTLDEIHDMPFDAKLLEDSDYHLQYQGILESSSEDSKKSTGTDMFFKYFSIDSTHLPAEVKRPKLYFSEDEMKWLKKTCTDLGINDDHYVVGIQVETSAPLRNFPHDRLKAVIDVLAKEDKVKIVLIGGPQQAAVASYHKGNNPSIVAAVNFTVRQSIVLANRYDLMISPDSFMVQAAGALGKPLIGLYGPFPCDARMKYFENAIGLEPKVVCSPCFKHDFRPCIKGFPSPCFTQIRIEDVLQAADYLRYKSTKKHFNFMNHFMRTPDLSEVEKYLLSADKGLCFFPGYFKHPNMIRVDTNRFCNPDSDDLSQEFKRDFYPFVLFMNDFSPKGQPVYHGSKGMMRPGGYMIVYKDDCNEQFFAEIKQDLGKSFVLLYSKFDANKRTGLIVGKKQY